MKVGGTDFDEHRVSAAEGFPLAAFDNDARMIEPAADGDTRPTIVLVNGLGGNLVTWRHLLAHIAPRHRVVTWDYRGLYGSRFDPVTRAAAVRGELALSPEAHVDDALRVLDHLGIERAVFIGWSMGVQVNFEIARHARDRMLGIIQICGAAGRAVATTFLGRSGLRIIPPAMNALRMLTERNAPWLGRVASSPAALALAKVIGAVAPSVDAALAAEIVRDYVKLDFDVYNRILMSLGDHDTSDILPELELPVMIVAGTRDAMTPLPLARSIADRLPDGELVVVEGGTHYLPIEFPDTLNAAVTRFLERWSPAGVLPASRA